MLICMNQCIGESETSISIQMVPGERLKVVKKVRNAAKILVLGRLQDNIVSKFTSNADEAYLFIDFRMIEWDRIMKIKS